MPIAVTAPLAGRVVPLGEVPDPVFAGLIVGPGIAIDPDPADRTVVAPIAGQVLAAHPHAFIIRDGDGHELLVHLGIDTVRMDGEGFTILAGDDQTVSAGQPLIEWSVEAVQAAGFSPLVPIIALQASAGKLTSVASPGSRVEVGAVLFDWA